MAICFPERLPSSITDDPSRAAECKVFDSLSQLSSKFTVFYSVAWQVRSLRNGARDGEADFIVAHPDLGVMIIEVKGGGIQYKSHEQQWYSTDRYNIQHPIKDPVQQARNSKGALLDKLRDLPDWRDGWLTVGYMICFPDIVYSTSLRPDLSREIVLDSGDLSNVEDILKNAFAYYAGEDGRSGALGQDRLQTLTRFLASSFELNTPLGVELEYQDQQLVQLTERQMGILQFIRHHRRALIEGCAGSGKTMLALEKARRLSEQGFEVLFTCFNAPLAEYLEKRVPERVYVHNFHGLCRNFAKEAGIGFRLQGGEQDFYDDVLPNMLLEAIDELGDQHRFDAIVVDEGQDFLPHWLEILMFLLRDSEQGIFYIFRDNNQNIYNRVEGLSSIVTAPPYSLDTNCRNTQKIHEVVDAFYQGEDPLDCIGPPGFEPEVHCYQNDEGQLRLLRSRLHELVNDEHISPRDIVVLTLNNPDKTALRPGLRLGNFRLAKSALNPQTDIRVSSIHRFKGLESKVVIIAGIHQVDAEWLSHVFYVGASRARTYLVLLVKEEIFPLLPATVKQNYHPC